MTAICDGTIKLLVISLLLLAMLLMMPARVETADSCNRKQSVCTEAVPYEYPLFSQRFRNFITHTLHIPSLMKKDPAVPSRDDVFDISGFHVRTYTPQALFQETDGEDCTDAAPERNIRERIFPLVEISYSLTSSTALELSGHLDRLIGMQQILPGDMDCCSGCTLFFGPSLSTGSPGDEGRLYTKLGIGYTLAGDIQSGSCPASLGAGFSVGIQKGASDIRVGYNQFNAAPEASSNFGSHKGTDASSVFLFVTYNFGS